jgi:hypothetical protein
MSAAMVMSAFMVGAVMLAAMAGAVMLAAIVGAVVFIAGAAIPPANGGDDVTDLAGSDYRNSFKLSRHYCKKCYIHQNCYCT